MYVPPGWPLSLDSARPGLPARSSRAAALNSRADFLAGSFKHGRAFLLSHTFQGVPVDECPSTDPIILPLRVPPYTLWAAWRAEILTPTAGFTMHLEVDGSTHYQRATLDVSDEYQWIATNIISDSLSGVQAALDVHNPTGQWVDRDLYLYFIGSGGPLPADAYFRSFELDYLREVAV